MFIVINSFFATPPGEEDLGGHPDHAAGHDGAG